MVSSEDTIRMAQEANAPAEACTMLPFLHRFAALVAAAEREKVIQWMVERQYATGHGDTTEDLLAEMDWQIRERERNGCLKACEQIATKYHMKRYATDWQAQECIAAIKARGES